MKNLKLFYYFIITILFVYVFVQFLELTNSNNIYKFYTDYIMNKYCLIIYILLLFVIVKYDTYTTVLLFILIIGPFRCSKKEYFNNYTNPITTVPLSTTLSTIIKTNSLNQTETEKINDIVNNTLNIDDNRFKMDNVKKD